VAPAAAQSTSPVYLQLEDEAPYRSLADRGLTRTQVLSSGTQVAVSLPFTFDYLGDDYDRIIVDAAGFIRFSDTASPSNFDDPFTVNFDALPATLSPNYIIAPFWLNFPGIPVVYRATEGVAPNRIFYIEYTDVEVSNPSDATADASYMIALHEGLGRFEVSYDGDFSAPTFGTLQAVAGYERSGSASDDFGVFASCTTNSNCDATDYENELVGTVFTVAKAIEPELELSNLEVLSGVLPGETVTATLTVDNVGTQGATGVDVSFFLSTDGDVDPVDREVATLTDAFDAPVGTTQAVVDFTLPSDVEADRRFYLYAQVDPSDELGEIIETDNTVIADEPNFGTGFDVEISRCVVTTPAEMIFAGADITYQVTVQNRGIPYTDPLDVQLWASPDDRLDTGTDILAGTVSTGALPDQNEVTVALRGALPNETLEPGAYFPICVADPNDVFEELDAAENNTFIGRPQDRFAITIPPLTILEGALPDATVGEPYEYEFQVNGGTFEDRSELTFEATGLPEGLEVTAAGVLQGQPARATAEGGVELTVTVRDGGEFDRGFFTLVVDPAAPVVLADTELPAGQLGVEYGAQLSAEGGVGEIAYVLSGGSLPPGLGLSIEGAVSGVPTEPGDYEFQVTARDTPIPGGEQQEDSGTFTISIAGGDFGLVTTDLPGATVGEPYEATIESTGAVLPVTWQLGMGDRLPDGLSSAVSGDTASFVISGTPIRLDSQAFDVVATDAIGRALEVRFDIDVQEAPEPTCPGDPGCPDEPAPVEPSDGGGCSAAGPTTLAPWLLLVGVTAIRRRRAERAR
jgi:uncharacterized protein (TIGR03382 family)